MSQACEGWRGEIGAYIVGALEPGAGARVRRHLRTCRTCRAEFEDLVPVRDWLTKLTHADGSGAGRRPGSAPLLPVRPALPMRLWPALPLPRPRGLRSVAAVTVAAAVAVLAVVLGRPGTPAFQAGELLLSIGVAAGARTRSSASHARGGWA